MRARIATARLAATGESSGDAGQAAPSVRDNWWWFRGFAGEASEVGAVRRWVRDLLPPCEPLGDVMTIASELAANAVRHTLSGGADFMVEVAWEPAMVRVVVGDRGSPGAAPRVVRGADGTGSRGLFIVQELSAAWGIAGDGGGRWVWADVAWPAGHAPVPGGGPGSAPADSTLADSTAADDAALAAALARGFPLACPWWGGETRTWWASRPRGPGATAGLIGAPSPGALGRMLEALYSPRQVSKSVSVSKERAGNL